MIVHEFFKPTAAEIDALNRRNEKIASLYYKIKNAIGDAVEPVFKKIAELPVRPKF